MYDSARYLSPIGELTLACDGAGRLVGLWLAGQKYFPSTLPVVSGSHGAAPIFAQTKDWLDRYFAGGRPSPGELPLAPAGSAFRQAVWKLLLAIPYGEVTTYGAIARAIATQQGRRTMSGQAVGGAVGHNPISIIIPCHRVAGSGGSLTGYAGGLDKKIWLLTHEGADMTGLFRPKRGSVG